LKPRSRAIYIRNAVIFLLVYVFMMGVMTVVSAGNAEKRMKEKAQAATQALSDAMKASTLTIYNQGIPASLLNVYYQMNTAMTNAAGEHIYLRAELYDGLDQLIAKTSNVIILQTNTGTQNYPTTQQFLLLDTYMSAEEIGSFFGSQWYTGSLGLGVRITGTDSGQGGIVPQKIELFSDWTDTTLLKTKTFSTVTDNAQVFGDGGQATLYLERIANSGPLTKTDQQRYAACTEIAQPALQKWRDSRAYSGVAGSSSGNIFVNQWDYTYPIGSGNTADDRFLSVGLQFFPLEVAASQLQAVYIWSFVFMAVLLLILSEIMSNLFRRQAELEQTRRTLTNAIAHELKTPLGVIRGYSEGLKENINEEKRGHYLDVIIDETAYMDTMILNMLSLSRLESGTIKLNLSPASLKEMMEGVLKRFDKMAEDKQLSVSVAADDGAIIRCDKVMIELVLSNFLSNAVRHTPENGHITMAAERRPDGLIISVENTGSPIPAQAMPYLWDAYYKVDPARSRAEGTGLGLSIAKAILEQHGFRYGVQNTVAGVRFWFAAPMAAPSL